MLTHRIVEFEIAASVVLRTIAFAPYIFEPLFTLSVAIVSAVPTINEVDVPNAVFPNTFNFAFGVVVPIPTFPPSITESPAPSLPPSGNKPTLPPAPAITSRWFEDVIPSELIATPLLCRI